MSVEQLENSVVSRADSVGVSVRVYSCKVFSSSCEIVYLDISERDAVLARLPRKASSRRRGETLTKSRRLHRLDWNTFQVDLASTLDSTFSEGIIDSTHRLRSCI